MPKNVRRCAAVGCVRLTASDHLMCSCHWWKVPSEMRKEIWRAYRMGRGSSAHMKAIRRAVEYLKEKET